MPQDISQYILANSLVNHTGSPLTNVPHWTDYIAEAAGHTYELSGHSGFMPQFADAETPGSNWGFAGVNPAWDAESEPFETADLDVIMIGPANFIQWQPAEAPYLDGSRSPLSDMLDVVGDMTTAHPTANILIYQGWADLGIFSEDLSSADTVMAAYHDYNQGDYLDWFTDLAEQVNAADPDAKQIKQAIRKILNK